MPAQTRTKGTYNSAQIQETKVLLARDMSPYHFLKEIFVTFFVCVLGEGLAPVHRLRGPEGTAAIRSLLPLRGTEH